MGAAAAVPAVGVAHVAADRRAPAAAGGVVTETPVSSIISETPSLSADGHYLVYAGAPAGPDDTRASTTYLQDRETGTTVELTAPVTGVRPGDSVFPVISSDGCNVAVITQMAYDLFRDDDGGNRWDVYITRLPWCEGTLGEWQLVSTSRGQGFESVAGDDVSPLFPPAISGEGSVVAYTHSFDFSDPEVTGVTVADLTVPLGEPGRLRAVAGTPGAAPDTTFRYHGIRQPSLSEDGTVLAVTSDADLTQPLGAWAPGPRPGGFATSHVFVWDRANTDAATAVRRISLSPAGEAGDASDPAVSGDGQKVAFVSTANNLVGGATLPACTTVCLPQVYLYDRTTGFTSLVSREPGDPAAPAVGANLGATQPALSRSGDEVWFVTRSTNLFPTRSAEIGAVTDGDVVVAVPSTGTVQRLTTLADGVTPAPAVNGHPSVSANGRVVAFDTLAAQAFGGFPLPGRQVAVITKAPRLSLASLDLGTVAVGYPGPEWYLVLSNDGPSSFIPATVEVSNSDFLISGGTCVDQAGTPVPPGGACTVNLMFMPTREGKEKGTLTVAEEGFGALTIESELTGSGGEPALMPTPGGAEAAPTLVGERAEPMVFSVGNVAFNPVAISSVRLAGSNPDDFTIGKDECSRRRIDAGAVCDVEILFTPTAGGLRTASVVVTTADGSYTTMLVSGAAHYEPKLAASTTTVVAPAHLAVVGAGFAPHTKVTVSWADGGGRPVQVTTDASGSLLADLLVRPNDRPGNRTVVAQTSDGQVATAVVTVVVPHRGPNAASAHFG